MKKITGTLCPFWRPRPDPPAIWDAKTVHWPIVACIFRPPVS